MYQPRRDRQRGARREEWPARRAAGGGCPDSCGAGGCSAAGEHRSAAAQADQGQARAEQGRERAEAAQASSD
ncbi:hypothetical protein ACIRN4_08405 [Pimelobacter simplex]|uniref:hypothetical protein n=1 Tax=Nocardioidaceae TaxID=85015 RepID=UPI0015E8675C|nr:hypothetical protein [Nocardioides humi]